MTRPRNKPIKVFVTDEERAAIGALAASANLSLSSYLRAAGLNQTVRSVFDIQAVTELSKVNGELGRVAALLKIWLDEKHGSTHEVQRMMKEFRDLQKQTHELMGKMTR